MGSDKGQGNLDSSPQDASHGPFHPFQCGRWTRPQRAPKALQGHDGRLPLHEQIVQERRRWHFAQQFAEIAEVGRGRGTTESYQLAEYFEEIGHNDNTNCVGNPNESSLFVTDKFRRIVDTGPKAGTSENV